MHLPNHLMHIPRHGTSKDRKAIIKSLKTFVTKVCTEEHGHVVLLAAFDAVDDTKLIGKAIIGEMVEHFEEIVTNEHGKKVIMYLAAGMYDHYIVFNNLMVSMDLQNGGSESGSKGGSATSHIRRNSKKVQ